MEVTLNKRPVTVATGTTLADILQSQGVKTNGIATAVNGTVIPAAQRDSTVLNDGDNIVVITAFYGG